MTGPEIRKNVQQGTIEINPYIPGCVTTEGYDVHLGGYMAIYECVIPKGILPAIPYDKEKFKANHDNDNFDGMLPWFESGTRGTDYHEQYRLKSYNYDFRNTRFYLDPCDEDCHKLKFIQIPETGLLLNPQFLFIGNTVEQVRSSKYHINIDGTSTIARNGGLIHHTAGNIAVGFSGQIVLEISIKHPLVLYPYMKIGQLLFSPLEGEIEPYNTPGYQGQTGPKGAKTMSINQEHTQLLKSAEQNLFNNNAVLQQQLRTAMYASHQK